MASASFSESRVVLPPSYSNLPDSARQASFDRSLRTGRQYARVVDSVSCRQMYLLSYTFTRKESMTEKTKKYIGEVTKKVFGRGLGFRMRRVPAKYDQVPCPALFSAVHRILTCTARIDVADTDVHRYF